MKMNRLNATVALMQTGWSLHLRLVNSGPRKPDCAWMVGSTEAIVNL
jgi:hypothetical protein